MLGDLGLQLPVLLLGSRTALFVHACLELFLVICLFLRISGHGLLLFYSVPRLC